MSKVATLLFFLTVEKYTFVNLALLLLDTYPRMEA